MKFSKNRSNLTEYVLTNKLKQEEDSWDKFQLETGWIIKLSREFKVEFRVG